jgi:uncharacterized protein
MPPTDHPNGATVADFSSDLDCTLTQLFVHPIKSCGSISSNNVALMDTGLDWDRCWMVVDPQGLLVTQREQPRMALIQPTLRHSDMVLRAPGMLALHLQLEAVEKATRAQVWDDIVKAYDMGDLAAQWFSDYLKIPVRLVRFDPEEMRQADPAWTGDLTAHTMFSDGFPLLVANAASLAELNGRLTAKGIAAVTMQRFRPNLVFSGWQAFDEDNIDEIEISTDAGPVVLRLVKPCSRCSMPNVDPLRAATSNEPGDTLAGYRADPRVDGAITFGFNAVVVRGEGQLLRAGQRARASWKFA